VSSKEVSLTKNKREDLQEGKSKQSDVLTKEKKRTTLLAKEQVIFTKVVE
jgi:hypothetical protein